MGTCKRICNEKMRAENQKLLAQLEAQNETSRKLIKENKEYSDQVESLTAVSDELREELNEKRNEWRNARHNVRTLREDVATYKERIRTLRGALDESAALRASMCESFAGGIAFESQNAARLKRALDEARDQVCTINGRHRDLVARNGTEI